MHAGAILGMVSYPPIHYMWKNVKAQVPAAWTALKKAYPFLKEEHFLAVE
jgi:hypothetical protein